MSWPQISVVVVACISLVFGTIVALPAFWSKSNLYDYGVTRIGNFFCLTIISSIATFLVLLTVDITILGLMCMAILFWRLLG